LEKEKKKNTFKVDAAVVEGDVERDGGGVVVRAEVVLLVGAVAHHKVKSDAACVRKILRYFSGKEAKTKQNQKRESTRKEREKVNSKTQRQPEVRALTVERVAFEVVRGDGADIRAENIEPDPAACERGTSENECWRENLFVKPAHALTFCPTQHKTKRKRRKSLWNGPHLSRPSWLRWMSCVGTGS
jgi:hypothetical protein